MAFNRIPTEALIDIFKYAGVDETISSWRSLASVNQRFNGIVIPMLYSRFDETSRSSVPRFLRTALANPELANHVRIYVGSGIASGESLDVSTLGESDFEACKTIVERMEPRPEMVADWMLRIREGNWHALTSILLVLLSNLEDLELIGYREDEAGHMRCALGMSARLQQSGTTGQFSLEHLTDISLSAPTPQEEYEPYGSRLTPEPEYLCFSDTVPFLMLPSVDSVAISRLSSGEMEHNGWAAAISHEPLNLRVRDLELNDTCLDMDWLHRFLHHFPLLRRFSYNHVAEEQGPDFLPQRIGRAIAHLRPCLEELEISSLCEQNGKYTTPREIGSLAGFERLRSIDVEGNILFGDIDPEDWSTPLWNLGDILPGTLESLIIRNFDSQSFDLRELLPVKEEKFPELKRVQVKGLGWWLDNPKRLRREFKAMGVKLIL